ncbi:MAG: hypothetical protein AAGJ37_15935 [Pseudomonadota bacterium]
MRKNISIISFFVLSLIPAISHAAATSQDASKLRFEQRINKVKAEMEGGLIASSNEYKTLHDLEIVITKTILLPTIAVAALYEDRREILISNEFLHSLDSFSGHLAELLKETNFYRISDIRDGQYDNTSGQLISRDWDTDDKELHNFFMETGILDVISHELGHHIEDAFYPPKAPPAFAYEMESIAEDWSVSFKRENKLDKYKIGRIISLGAALRVHQKGDYKEPPHLEYARSVATRYLIEACYRSKTNQAEILCKLISEMS